VFETQVQAICEFGTEDWAPEVFYVFKVGHVWTIFFHFRLDLRNNSLKENNSSYYNNLRCYFFLSTKSYI